MNRFKIGDVVRVIREPQEGYLGSKSIGDVAAVSEVYDAGYEYYRLSETGNGALIAGDKLELAYPNRPHKHAECIKEWADGAAIEYKCVLSGWLASKSPGWNIDIDYRIKPSKSDKDIKIEELEEKALQLAKDIATLKED